MLSIVFFIVGSWLPNFPRLRVWRYDRDSQESHRAWTVSASIGSASSLRITDSCSLVASSANDCSSFLKAQTKFVWGSAADGQVASCLVFKSRVLPSWSHHLSVYSASLPVLAAVSGLAIAIESWTQTTHSHTQTAPTKKDPRPQGPGSRSHPSSHPSTKLPRSSVAGCRVARGPNCPSSWRSAQGVGLIPVNVSGESVQDGGGVEQKEDRV